MSEENGDRKNEEVNNANDEKKGVKLPYFHRKLSTEEEQLIGDIRPKRIDGSNEAPKKEASNKFTEGSAWNAANTWEERDTTKWGKEQLNIIFKSDKIQSSKVKFHKIEKIEGNSSVTHVRGRARFLYEWSFSLDFEISGLTGKFKGTAKVADVINDQLDDIEMELTWNAPKPALLDGRSLQNSLKEEIVKRMKLFEEEYQNMSR
jgi:hypothetical protein